MNHCDIPIYLAMCKFWREVPPAAVQLRRIASYLGLKVEPPSSATVQTSASATVSTFDEVVVAASQAGVPVFPGKPNDPMLDLIGDVTAVH